MTATRRRVAVAAAALIGVGAAAPALATTHRSARSDVAGHVYAATNSSSGNAIDVFDRSSNGKLRQVGSYPTGGKGSGAPQGSGFEQSQNALVLGGQPGADNTPFTHELFAVNPGSDSITAFRTSGDTLRRIGSPVASGGTKPTSLTVNGHRLYVLNEGALPLGEGGANPSVRGFRISAGGALHPIAGSTRSLGDPAAGAAQVEFNPAGTTVTVTERTPSNLVNFPVKSNGKLGKPTTTSVSGSNPFGFAESRLHNDRIFVAQGNFPPPTKGAASSYQINAKSDAATPISGNVANGQSDTCWVVLAHHEKYAYVTNFFSNTVSSYRVTATGTLVLLQQAAGTTDANTPVGANDEAVSGSTLYTRNFFDGTIGAFHINSNGTLRSLGTFGSVGPATGFGLTSD